MIMKKLYKGQKLYTEHHTFIIVAWDERNVYLKRANGEHVAGPRYYIGRTLFFEKPVTGERPSYKDTPSNEELSQYNTERKHGMPAAGKDMNTRSISKGSIYSKAAPRMKGSYGHHYKKKK